MGWSVLLLGSENADLISQGVKLAQKLNPHSLVFSRVSFQLFPYLQRNFGISRNIDLSLGFFGFMKDILKLRMAYFNSVIYLSNAGINRSLLELILCRASSFYLLQSDKEEIINLNRASFFIKSLCFSLAGLIFALALSVVHTFIIIFFLVVNIIFKKVRRINPKATAAYPPIKQNKTLSIVITNWNGVKLGLIDKCLSHLYKSYDGQSPFKEIIVVDDHSEDESVKFIGENYPEVKVIENKQNLGFLLSANRGIAAATGDIVMLLNNDVFVQKNFWKAILRAFDDPSIALAYPRVINEDGSLQWGVSLGQIYNGAFHFWNESETDMELNINSDCLSLYALGGALALRKSLFLDQELFDRLLLPVTWEDIDLSLTLQEQGYKVLYLYDSVVIHLHHATMAIQKTLAQFQIIHLRNSFLIFWKHITDARLLLEHLVHTWIKFVKYGLINDWLFFHSYFEAIKRFPLVIKKKIKVIQGKKNDELPIFQNVLSCYENALVKQFKSKIKILILCENWQTKEVLQNIFARIDEIQCEFLILVPEKNKDYELKSFIKEGQDYRDNLLQAIKFYLPVEIRKNFNPYFNQYLSSLIRTERLEVVLLTSLSQFIYIPALEGRTSICYLALNKLKYISPKENIKNSNWNLISKMQWLFLIKKFLPEINSIILTKEGEAKFFLKAVDYKREFIIEIIQEKQGEDFDKLREIITNSLKKSIIRKRNVKNYIGYFSK